jgi:hypothetical protein
MRQNLDRANVGTDVGETMAIITAALAAYEGTD